MKKEHKIAFVIVVLLVVALWKLPTQTMEKFKLAMGGLFLPLFGLSGTAHELTLKARETFVSRRELLRQNEELHRENEELRLSVHQLAEVRRENERLSILLNKSKWIPWRRKLAHVIARDPANWWRTAQIDMGSQDGVRPFAPVLTGDGLVGRVQSLGANRSTILLLGDPNLQVSVVVGGTETGVVMAGSASPQEDNMVDVNYLAGNSVVRPGQGVITSGQGGVFPAGIPVGQVVDVRSVDFGMATAVRVKLSANLNDLEEVWVIVP